MQWLTQSILKILSILSISFLTQPPHNLRRL
jgi:hypothetical protein